jgi:hypothetical protein
MEATNLVREKRGGGGPQLSEMAERVNDNI